MDIDQIQPDLTKAPPHVEGELLKQNTKKTPVISKWRSFFFVIHKDKLHYYNKKEDYHNHAKNPINVIRLSRVSDISESVFNKVPRKAHLNSGFSVIEKTTQGEQVYNLLAESPDMMRYWVHALRYVKAYWSKKEIRDTIINDEIDRKLIDQALREEEEEDGDNLFVGEYSLQDGGQDQESKSLTVTMYFADSSKVVHKVTAMDKVSDLLDRISDKLTSSAAQIWIVDNQGKEYSLDPEDPLDLYQSSFQQFFAVDPTHRVIVVFLDDSKEFVSTIVPCKITAQEVISNSDIAPKLDINGIANRGLFLKSNSKEELFEASECPCEALYIEKNGMIHRLQDGGHLVIKNKALDRGRPSKWKHKAVIPDTLDKTSVLQEELEEEEVEQRALARAQEKRKVIARRDYQPIPQIKEDQKNGESDEDDDDIGLDYEIVDRKSFTPPTAHRNFDSGVCKRSRTEVFRRSRPRAFVQATLDFPSQQPLISPPHVSPTSSPKRILPTPKTTIEISPPSASLMPAVSTDTTVPTDITSNTTEPIPTVVLEQQISSSNSGYSSEDGSSPLVRRRAVRSRPGRSSSSNIISHQAVKKRTESILADIAADDSRSSAFAIATSNIYGIQEGYSQSFVDEEEKKMEQLFSTSYQVKEDEERIKAELEKQLSLPDPTSTITPTTPNDNKPDSPEVCSETMPLEEPEADVLPSNPLFIQFDTLRQAETLPSSSKQGRPAAIPMVIHRPSILKIVLMQSNVSSPSNQAMDLISLSGVVLRKRKNVWELQEGSEFHDPSSTIEVNGEEGSIEKYSLPGGIVALYNNTSNSWYVLQPPSVTVPSPSTTGIMAADKRPSPSDTNYDANSEALRLYAHHQFLQKRALVTEIGSSFNEILGQFKDCRSSEEKKNIGSDMANSSIGHMVRGRFCTSIAALLLDGFKLQRLGFVQQDAWKAINSFCQEGNNLYAASTSNIYLTIESKVLKAIKGESRLADNHMRFRTFVCLCISRGVFLQWLSDLPLLKETIRKNYSPDSFLYLVSIARDPTYEKLYEEILLSLQPLPYIPFQLSITFEVQTSSAELLSVSAAVGGGGSRSVSPVPSLLSSQQTTKGKEAQSKSVMESTGQRTSEVTSLINESFSEDRPKPMKPAPSSPNSEKLIDTFTIDKFTKSSGGPGWLKKFATGISNLNVGGAITGSPVPVRSNNPSPIVNISSQQHEGTSSTQTIAVSNYVEALFDNTSADTDSKELKFYKGDTLKVERAIDENWLLCMKGTETGIVPMNYVRIIT